MMGGLSMENSTTRILQSKYFNATFNTAIFDGPLRVYFTQTQEGDALKVYFSLQSHFFKEENILTGLREHFPKNSTLFIMIYPTKDAFQQSFDESFNDSVVNDRSAEIAYSKMGEDYVIGVQGPVTDKTKDEVLQYIEEKFLALV